MAMQRTEAQNAVIQNRGGTLLVSAAAGSGKTSVLVERLMERILGEGLCIDQFLIITFTKAAAEELRGRIGRALSERLREDPKNRHLQKQVILLYKAQISTIHSLCTALLREWGHALELPLDFSLCEQDDASILMLQSLNDVLELRYESITPSDPFSALLDVLSSGRDDSRLMDIVLDVYSRMQSHANPDAWMETQKQQLALEGITDAGETVWGQLLLRDSERLVAYWLDTLAESVHLIEEEESLAPYAESLLETQSALEELHAAFAHGWDAAVASCEIPFPRLKSVRNCPNPLAQEQVKQVRSRCKEAMENLSERFTSGSQPLLDDMRQLYPAMLGLFDLVRDFSTEYAKRKTRKAVLDFSDLEHKTVALLYDQQGNLSDIAHLVGKRFAEIMVDEYQDTNQVQNSIFSALSQGEQNFFLVGDVKQSIYRFRLADPTIFLDKYRRFAPYQDAKEGESRKILLSQNFRSRPEVLDATNYLFSNIMSVQLGEMEYSDAEALYPGGNFPSGEDFETELHVLHFEEMTEESTEEKAGNHELEARFVASEIAKLLHKPFLVSDGTGGLRPITPDDIAILIRSPGSVRHFYAKALRELQIAWAAEDEGAFFETTEVSVMLSFLQLIDNPLQDIPLLSVLHSPLFAFDAEQLATLRFAGKGTLYEAMQAAATQGDAHCASFLHELETLRFIAVDQSCRELLWMLYERTNALALFRRMPGGAEREENLLAFYELACRFEHAGHKGLFGFLYHIARLQENGNRLTKSAASTSSGVKLLSIHRSKGLEYPVVFLCGLSRRFNYSDLQKPVLFHTELGLGSRALDSERMVEYQTLPRQAVALQLKQELLAEEMRLLYVAMTRAKDKLIMTHTLSYGENDLKKLAASLSSPLDPNVLSGCSCTGQWILLAALSRPEGEVLRKIAQADAPKLPVKLGTAWKIFYRKGIPAPAKGLTDRMMEEDTAEQPPLSAEALWQQLNWHYPYDALASIPAKITATALSQHEGGTHLSENSSGIKPPYATPTFHRPRFATKRSGLTPAQKGSALHTAMQCIDLAQTETVEQIEEELHRFVVTAHLTQQEADSVKADQIWRFFHSEIGQRMKKASKLHREFPFTLLVPAENYYDTIPPGEELLMQGVIDCWFEEGDGIIILDFKTNRLSEQEAYTKAELYRAQLCAYENALECITGKQISQKILCFLTPGCTLSLCSNGSFKKV